MNQPADLEQFEHILQHLRQTRGFDFTAYKRPSLIRRVLKRMQAVETESFEDYLDYLQLHQDEFTALFNTILINVTDFFRDPDVWEYMRAEALPRMLATPETETQFRVWSAGCASGQEAYTVLMLLAELLGLDAVRERVKVYATDADEEALNEARLATYTDKQVESVPPDLLEKYFDRSGAGYSVNGDLRRLVIFGRHDLVQDAPISRVDLLLCRNTLMYFHAEAQDRILSRLFFSLNPTGHILLGRAEMVVSHSTMFVPVDLERRLFAVVGKPGHRERMPLPLFDDASSVMGTRITYKDVTDLRSPQNQLHQSKQELETAYEELQSTNEELGTMNEELQSSNEELQVINDELRCRSSDLNLANAFLESVFASLRSAVIVVDRDLRIQVWNHGATDLWGVRQDEAEGSHLLDLDVGFDVGDLRQPVREVMGGTDVRELTISGVNRRGKAIACRVSVAPLRPIDGSAHGAILLMDEQPAPAV